jgi:serine/threonine-protein kinase ULK/ATG1
MLNIKIVSTTQKLYDKYEIYLNRIVGKGSYSNVYLGKIIDKTIIDEKLISSDTIAVKKIKMDNLDQRTFKMINDEVNIMHKIMKMGNSCNNIIKCIDIIEEFDFIYIIMEYCHDGDLTKIIGKPIKENVVKYYFGQIVNALYYLSENNIIHRDIKPKNILLKNNKKELVLCDFGFARIKTMQRVKTICGSPLYMAPELLEEKTYTEIVDVWAIGMILYEMIYGKHPYEDCKDIDDLKEFSKKSIMIPPVYNTNTNVSNECINLMKQMLEKEEKKRITLDNLFKHQWIKDLVNKHTKIANIPIMEVDESSETSETSENESTSSSDTYNNLNTKSCNIKDKNRDFDSCMIFNISN